MTGMAEASERASSSLNDASDDEFRRILDSATNSILAAQAWRKPYPLIKGNLHPARPLDDELLDRPWIVSRAESACCPVLIDSEPAVG